MMCRITVLASLFALSTVILSRADSNASDKNTVMVPSGSFAVSQEPKQQGEKQ